MNTKPIKHILLVEDDEGYALLLRRLFERAQVKAQPIWFADGVELFDYIRDTNVQPNSLMLLDLNLPVMSGFEILENLRRNYPHSELPIIVMSTTIRDKDFQRCIELGANSFLKKPISFSELEGAATQAGLKF